MRINLISNDNGAGLSKDMLILESLLTKHEVQRVHYTERPPRADVNIFLELLKFPEWLDSAAVNILIPNLEWFYPKWLKTAQRMDAVFCKTRDAETWFMSHGCNAVYTGFTSVDMGVASIRERVFIHVAGKSISKGTKELIAGFGMLGNEFELCLIGGNNPRMSNIHWHSYADDVLLREMIRSYAFHLCPSLAEGWGHYIHEAKSCGAVILTTDADPMNTFFERRDGFFCKTQISRPHHAGVFHQPKPESIAEEVRKMAALTDAQIAEIGKRVRADFLLRDQVFRATFKAQFERITNESI